MTIVSPNTLNQLLTTSVSGSIKSPLIAELISSIVGTFTNNQSNNYTLQLSDFGTCVEVNSSFTTTVTFPNTVPFEIGTVISICQIGGGQVILANSANVTFVSTYTYPQSTRTKGSVIFAKQRAANNWIIWGDIP